MVLEALVGGGKGAETESASCASPRGLWKNSGLHALEVPQFQFIDKVVDVLGVIWSFVGATLQIKVSIGSCVRWVTFEWRLALFTLRVSVLGLSCTTSEARGDSTGAILGLVATCPFLC